MNDPTGLSLRPASPDDLSAVLEIEKTSYPEPWTRAHFEKELSTPWSRFLVLTDDETDSIVAGYLVYWLQAEGVSLLNLTVRPQLRGQGLSRTLMQAMIRETVHEDLPRILLEVRESNTVALRLYESTGFRRTAVRKNFYADGESALVMELKTSELPPLIH